MSWLVMVAGVSGASAFVMMLAANLFRDRRGR
jgi:hypothetical protein